MTQRVCPRCRSAYGDEVAFCPRDGTALHRDERTGSLVGQVLAGRYRIEAPLGQGAMASVYLAEHTMLRRKCAFKVIREGMVQDPDSVARFNREAANASGIMHPNVAAIFDFGDAGNGMLFLAMEYVAGEPLAALLARVQLLSPRRATSIAWQIADGLTAAHDAGIVHRDLKPENVMLGRNRDGSDLAKVVDFGVARIMGVASQKLTSTGIVVGTQDYMSPEQLSGDAVDARSDIYSLGIILFRMITGRHPFEGSTTHESFRARLTGRPFTLAEARPDMAWPQSLQSVLDIALQPSPDQRYQSAADLGSDLVNAVLDWLPDDDASPEPWNQRLRYQTPVRVRASREF